jgi:DNA-binding transcriptional LysR family regulator
MSNALQSVTIRQMRAFAETYRLRNLTHAAESLHLTQSAVSALIRQFEESLGVQLFERTTRLLRPTKAADEVIVDVRDVLNRITAMHAHMQEKAQEDTAVLAFSCVPALASSVVPTVLAEFRRRHPHVRTVLFDDGDGMLIDRVLSEEAEFSISSFAHDPEAVAQFPLHEDYVSVVCARSSALAGKDAVTWVDLLEQPIINLSKGVALQQMIREFFPSVNRAYKPAYHVGFIDTALAMASQGLGVVVLPGYFVKGNPHYTSLIAKKLHDPVVAQKLIIHTRKGRALSAQAEAFLAMLRAHLLLLS